MVVRPKVRSSTHENHGDIRIVRGTKPAYLIEGIEDEGSRQGTLYIVRLSDNPKTQYGSLKSVVDYVASHLSDLGITQGSVLMAAFGS